MATQVWQLNTAATQRRGPQPQVGNRITLSSQNTTKSKKECIRSEPNESLAPLG